MRSAVDLAGTSAANVADHELQRPPDGRVGAVALAERAPEFIPIALARSAADHHRADRHRGGEDSVDVELVGARRFDRGQHPRQILRLAAGHHRSDRHLLDGDLDEIGRHGGDDVRWAATSP